jgi:hypothetical protein
MEMMPCDALLNTARRSQQRISNPLELVVDPLEVFSLLLDKDSSTLFVRGWLALALGSPTLSSPLLNSLLRIYVGRDEDLVGTLDDLAPPNYVLKDYAHDGEDIVWDQHSPSYPEAHFPTNYLQGQR